MRLHSSDIKELKIFKHYRIVRKWACKTNDLNDADLELLIYLEAIDLFTKDDFKKGTYSYSWDNRRWNRLLKQVYRIILGEEDMPTIKLEKSNKYSFKVITKAVEYVNKDKTR
jgi:hypothetical protein